MSTTLPDAADEWVSQWRAELTDRAAFAEAAADFTATFRFEITPDESYDGEPITIRLDVADGDCPAATLDEGFDYDFGLRGPFEAWKAMLQDELSVTDAVMDGPFTVEGDTMALLQRQEAVAEIVRAARDVDTTFSA